MDMQCISPVDYNTNMLNWMQWQHATLTNIIMCVQTSGIARQRRHCSVNLLILIVREIQATVHSVHAASQEDSSSALARLASSSSPAFLWKFANSKCINRIKAENGRPFALRPNLHSHWQQAHRSNRHFRPNFPRPLLLHHNCKGKTFVCCKLETSWRERTKHKFK